MKSLQFIAFILAFFFILKFMSFFLIIKLLFISALVGVGYKLFCTLKSFFAVK